MANTHTEAKGSSPSRGEWAGPKALPAELLVSTLMRAVTNEQK